MFDSVNPLSSKPNPEEFIKLFKSLEIEIIENKKILHIKLNRPKQLNALNEVIFIELARVFSDMQIIFNKYDIRCVILSGNGNCFSSGLDISSQIPQSIIDLKNDSEKDIGRKSYQLYNDIRKLQDGLTAIENCPIPVICAIHGYCLGGALSILVCTDVKIATKDSKFSIKEIDIGITADLGVLQRIIKQTGRESLIKKLSFTGEIFCGEDAFKFGFVEELVEDYEDLMKRSFQLAKQIVTKSPLILWGIKRTINYSRDHSVKVGLDMVATMNSSLLLADDIATSLQGFLSKNKVMYPKL